MRLRNYLILFGAAAFLPFLIAIVAATYLSARSEQAAIEFGLFRTARAISAAIDRELTESASALLALSVSDSLIADDVPRFYNVAQRALAGQSQWREIVLLDRSGRTLFATAYPLGTELPSLGDREYIRKAIATRQPAISRALMTSRYSGRLTLGVAVPVYAGDALKYVLVASYAFERLSEIFKSIGASNDFGAVLDSNGLIITRARSPHNFAGKPAASETTAEAARLGVERSLRSRTQDGDETFGVVTPSKVTGWSVAMGLPIGDYQEPIRRSIAIIGGGGLVVVILGGLSAGLVGRRIEKAIRALARAAEALGRGLAVDIDTGVNLTEVHQATASMKAAGELILRRSRERDEALASAERRARYQQAVAMIGQLAFEDVDLDALLQRVTVIMATTLRVDLCRLLELDPDGQTLLLRAGVGAMPVSSEPIRVEAGLDSLAGYTLLTEGPVVVVNHAEERRFKAPRFLGRDPAASSISVVIRTKDRPFGVMGVHSLSRRDFTFEDVQFCQSAAYLLSTILIRRENEAHLRGLVEQNEQFSAAINATNRGVVFTDAAQPNNPVLFVNPAFTRITGYAPEEVLGKNLCLLRGPETDPGVGAAIDRAIAENKLITTTILNYRKDGRPFWNEITIAPLPSQTGTSRIMAEIILDATARREAEEQLRQAQKMDALGKLTGGIAHDVNNLLTVILGNAETLQEKLRDNNSLLETASMIMRAAERGADLTMRLLAFARRQPLQPEPISVNAMVSGLEALLRHSLGERIAIEMKLDNGLPTIVADRPQLETAILNLAINARDAMPEGGTLTIATRGVKLGEADLIDNADAQPGDYVELSVTDDGLGMPLDILAKVFEPFFTTKEVGRGTGLGLSMVYGFVRQSGGHITIASESGRGTMVRLCFPNVAADSVSVAEDPAAGRSPVIPRGSETILVVEDDDMVAQSAATLLQRLGYGVAVVGDGRAAMAYLIGQPVDLLFTDIVMPGDINGFQLAEEARKLKPGLPVLFTSGYAAPPDERPIDGTVILRKPYLKLELARWVRAALDSGLTGPSPSRDQPGDA